MLSGSTSTRSAREDNGDPGASSKAKRELVSGAACNRCREKKIRCDGIRPACANCVIRQFPCEYDTEENETRQQAKSREMAGLQRSRDELCILVNFLRCASQADAQNFLASLRSEQYQNAETTAIAHTFAVNLQARRRDAGLPTRSPSPTVELPRMASSHGVQRQAPTLPPLGAIVASIPQSGSRSTMALPSRPAPSNNYSLASTAGAGRFQYTAMPMRQ